MVKLELDHLQQQLFLLKRLEVIRSSVLDLLKLFGIDNASLKLKRPCLLNLHLSSGEELQQVPML